MGIGGLQVRLFVQTLHKRDELLVRLGGRFPGVIERLVGAALDAVLLLHVLPFAAQTFRQLTASERDAQSGGALLPRNDVLHRVEH